jgi:glycosyltransferase involved in cell wall biosynthesis
LVSPRTEGTSVPLKIYTYLLSGKPIVATNLLTHTLVLNDDIAVLVEPTKEAVAEGLLKLIRDRELRQRLSQEAQQYAKDMYDPEQYREKLDQIYRTLESSLRVRQRHALP